MVAFIEGMLKRLPATSRKRFPPSLGGGHGQPDAWKDFVEMAKHGWRSFVTSAKVTLEPEESMSSSRRPGRCNFPDEEATNWSRPNGCAKYAGNFSFCLLRNKSYQGLVFLHETTN